MDTERRLNKIKRELKGARRLMEKASDEIFNQDISNYPIFVIAKEPINLGVAIANPESLKSAWHLYISTLEEFTTKKLIRQERINEFRKIYKDPEDFYCLFIIDNLGSKFVFIPID